MGVRDIQAKLFGPVNYVCGGHGARRPSHGTFRVPAGITIKFYVNDGDSLDDVIGQKVDQILAVFRQARCVGEQSRQEDDLINRAALLGRLRLRGHGEVERAARSHFALHPEATAVRVDDSLDDRQA